MEGKRFEVPDELWDRAPINGVSMRSIMFVLYGDEPRVWQYTEWPGATDDPLDVIDVLVLSGQDEDGVWIGLTLIDSGRPGEIEVWYLYRVRLLTDEEIRSYRWLEGTS